MHHRLVWILLIPALLISSLLVGETGSFLTIDTLEPSSVYRGCVNAITGDYVESNQELVVRSMAPLSLDRHMIGSSDYSGTLAKGTLLCELGAQWHNTNPVKKLRDRRAHRVKLHLSHPADGTLEYTWDGTPHSHWSPDLGRFYCNQGNGEVSGRTNPANNTVTHRGEGTLVMKRGDGEEAIYGFRPRSNHELYKRESAGGKLEKRILPNGITLSYSQQDLGMKPFFLTIEAKALDGKALGSISINEDAKDLPANWEAFVAEASDGQRLFIDRTNERNNQGMIQARQIKRMQLEGHPWVEYDYLRPELLRNDWASPNARRPVRRMEPNGRYLEFAYYYAEKTLVGGKWIDYRHIPNYKHSRVNPVVGRVREIFAPVGKNGERERIAEFRYQHNFAGGNRHDYHGGQTDVIDAYGNKAKYYYDYGYRLSHFHEYEPNDDDKEYLLRSIRFRWGYEANHNIGQLLCKVILARGETNKHERPVVSTEYTYDAFGNMTQETTRGNLTGNAPDFYQVDPKNNPTRTNKAEAYVIEQEYYATRRRDLEDRAKNLLKSRRQLGKAERFTYLDNTGLLESHIVRSDEGGYRREFRKYDANNFLIKTISDDGIGEQSDDLTGVTVRTITRITRSSEDSLYGFPKRVEKLYFDRETKEGQLLSAISYEYDPKTKLLMKEHHYDSNDTHRYTLENRYDLGGRRVYHKDAEGREYRWEYDENGNLSRELGPRPGCGMEYHYDLCNRLVRTDQFGLDGSRVTTYTYDYNDHCAEEKNWLGHGVTRTYDGLGRVRTESFSEQEHPTSRKYTYHVLGGIATETDELGYVTRYEYNSRGQPTEICYSDGSSESIRYDLKGREVYHCDSIGVVHEYEYDGFGHITSETMTSPVDETGSKVIKMTTHEYHGDLLLSTIDPTGLKRHFKYDGAGRLISKHVGKGREVYEYDSLGNLHKTRSWFGEAEPDHRVTIREFDLLGRVVEERITESDEETLLRRTAFKYDAADNLICLTRWNADGRALEKTTEYDYLDRPILITDWHDPAVEADLALTTIRYGRAMNDLGQDVERRWTTDPLGSVTIETMDTCGRVAMLERENSTGELLAQVDWVYDSVGNSIEESHAVVSPLGCSEQTIKREYGPGGRLEKIIGADGEITELSYNGFGQLKCRTLPDG